MTTKTPGRKRTPKVDCTPQAELDAPATTAPLDEIALAAIVAPTPAPSTAGPVSAAIAGGTAPLVVATADGTAVADATADAEADTLIDAATTPAAAPRQTNAALLRAMLAAPGGASVAQIMAATGWQAHTVSAALSGVRKSGMALVREKRDSETIYRIVNESSETALGLGGAVVAPPIGSDNASVGAEVSARRTFPISRRWIATRWPPSGARISAGPRRAR